MAHLVVLDGSRSGEEIPLTTSEVSVGRADDNTIPLDGPAISGHHCLIRSNGDKLLVIDLDSTNGTSVNGKPISEHELKRGDILTLGTTPVRIEGEELEQGGELPVEEIQEAEQTPEAEEAPPEAETELESDSGAVAHGANIRPRTRKDMAPVPQMKDFGKKHDNRKVWIVVTGVVSLVILVVLVWVITASVNSA